MRLRLIQLLVVVLTVLVGQGVAGGVAAAAPVLMISIDGLRPGDVLEARQRGVAAPVLQAMAAHGLYATGVRDALPSVTYPNHTTLVTGVWPARHGVASNTVFDPLRKNMDGWYWYASDIKVPTLWDAVHAAGRPTASIGWPVTVAEPAIDDDIPEYWRAHDAEDLKLIAALSTPGLLDQIAASGGPPLAAMADETPEADEGKARAAATLITLKHPAFFTLHLSSLDATQHAFGPDTPQAHATLARIDAAIGALVAAARRSEPDLVVAIVSDHGFAPVSQSVNLGVAFVQAGLMRLDAEGKPIAWDAAPWISGGSAAVVLAHPEDDALRARVGALLERLAADPASGVAQVIGRREIAAMGGAPDADFFVDARPGYGFAGKLTGPLITPSAVRGTHGYFPAHPEMRATFIVDGPALPRRGSLGEIDMRDIAPTVAEILGVALPSAAGKPLF